MPAGTAKVVRSQKMENPVNLKALAQFILLGDPSLQPVRAEEQFDAFSEYIDFHEARHTRRIALVASGQSALGCSGFPRKKIRGGKSKLHSLVRKIALQKGFNVGQNAVEAYEIVGRDNYANEMKARDVRQKVFIVTHKEATIGRTVKGVPLTRILVAHAENERLTSVSEHIRR
jgi:hypothetical protein